MKIIRYKLLQLVLVLSLVALFSGCSQEGTVFQVNDVVSDPGAFSGTLNIVGIVNAYSRNDATVIGIMDKAELQCTTPNCDKVLLPVRYQGDRPAIGDEIKVTGSIVGGKIFQAETLKVLANHNLGGQG